MQKKILITGASGFIGSTLVQYGLENQYEVWAAVRSKSSRQYLTDERIHFIELSLNDKEQLLKQLTDHRGKFAPFDYVIHAAGITKCRKEEDFYQTNTWGTRNLAEALIATESLREEGRFVFLSSLSVLGPIHEKDKKPYTSADRPNPNTAYGKSKLAAEKTLANIPQLNYIILRPTGVYGPRERDYFLMAKSINRHIDFAVGYRPQILTFIYVKDLVEAAYRALRHGFRGRSYILTDGKSYTSRTFSDILQIEIGKRHVWHIVAPLWFLWIVCCIAEKVAALLGKTATLNRDKYHIMRQRNWQCDISSARKDLGFSPQYPLVRGVKETVAWYKKANWL